MNNKGCVLYLVFTLFVTYSACAQQVELLDSGSGVSFRGLSAVSDKVVWVSGSKGTVGISTNSGKSWRYFIVGGYENREFRDIEAFDAVTAVIMAADAPAVLLKTTNAGRSWKKVYENTAKGMFLDAMDFRNHKSGLVLGDPVNGRFFMAKTSDGGDTWNDVMPDKLPVALEGEACFAASGTNLNISGRNEAFVSGGTHSRLFLNDVPIQVPIIQGLESQGANSVALWQKGNNAAHIVIAGGDFKAAGSRAGNCALSRDGGKTWIVPFNPPHGYRSCVEFVSATRFIACGVTGVDVSLDEGINWNNLSETGFHVCRKAKSGSTVFLAGDNGRIAKIDW